MNEHLKKLKLINDLTYEEINTIIDNKFYSAKFIMQERHQFILKLRDLRGKTFKNTPAEYEKKQHRAIFNQ